MVDAEVMTHLVGESSRRPIRKSAGAVIGADGCLTTLARTCPRGNAVRVGCAKASRVVAAKALTTTERSEAATTTVASSSRSAVISAQREARLTVGTRV